MKVEGRGGSGRGPEGTRAYRAGRRQSTSNSLLRPSSHYHHGCELHGGGPCLQCQACIAHRARAQQQEADGRLLQPLFHSWKMALPPCHMGCREEEPAEMVWDETPWEGWDGQ